GASYDKMATNMATLRSMIGQQRFTTGLREYGRRWAGKHPAPWDLFHTFNEAAGQDLWWFWRTWWWETWTLDQAVAEVTVRGDSTTIVIEDRGLAPMPVRLAVRRPGGGTQRYEIPVEIWLSGARRYELTIPSPVASVEIDPEHLFPDIDRRNNLWRGM
ncbi:MAG: M1 family peptidase, partial [Gemmatimonadota bacterium]